MDNLTLAKILFGKTKASESDVAAANLTSAYVVEMVAVTASSGGEVVVKNADEDSDEIWENGEPGVDFIELDEDGDYDEEAYDNVDSDEEADDGSLDMTDGDGADIEDSGAEAVAFTVEDYHSYAVAAAAEETGGEDDDLASEDDSVSDEVDDGDASDVESPGDPSSDDDLAGEDAEVAEGSDDEFSTVEDDDPDDSDEPLEGAEISDGSTVVETTVSVKEGDRVLVSIQDGHMTVIGVIGGGDESDANLTLAQETADEANAAALEAAKDAAEATEAAGNAQAKAEEADAAANAAQNAATEAQNAANTASQAAQNAQNTANQAATEAQEANEKATDAKAKADKVEADMAGVNAEVDSVKEDAAAIREEMLTSGDLETAKTELSASFATKTELSETETTLRKHTEDSVAEATTAFEQDYAKKTEVDGAIVDAKASLQTQISQNASGISSLAKSVETVEADILEQDGKVSQAIATANAAQSVADAAKTDAQEAATAASNAQSAANTANQAAASAQAKADDAKANAQTAKSAADEAAAELATAKAKLAEVEGNANATAEDLAEAKAAVANAQKAADDAAEDAANAKTAADTAQSTANTAKTNAANAQTAANNAQAKANEAKSAADAAQASADEAKADLAALGTRVTTAETKINQNSEAISLNATKTEEVRSDLASNYYTKTQTDAQIKVSADAITSTVSSVKATADAAKAAVDGLEIGGRNHAALSSLKRYVGGNLFDETPSYSVEGTRITASGQPVSGPLPGFKVHTDGAKEFTVSGYSDLASVRIYFKCFDAEEAETSAQTALSASPDADGRFVRSFDNVAEGTAYFHIGIGNDTVSDYYLDKLKIERGNLATDWTPAPEDMATVEQMNSAIEQKADSITSTVSKTYATQEALGTTNENVAGAAAAAARAQQTADSIVQLIISTDRSTTCRSASETVTATANVFRHGQKLTEEEIAELGIVRWYVNGLPVENKTGLTCTINACTATLKARLEAN